LQRQMIGTGNWYRLTKSGHAFVVDSLGIEIVSGKFPIGAILPGDAKLIDRFKVSRTVLREVMKTLSAKGLLVARARIGTRVNDRSSWNMFDRDVLKWHVAGALNEQFIMQVCDIRLALEPFAAGLAAKMASAVQISHLLDCADAMSRHDLNVETFARAKLDFHLSVLEASQNPFMRSLGNVVEASLVPMLRSGFYMPDTEKVLVLVHSCRRVADAIQKRNGDLARQAMMSHIEICRIQIQHGFKPDNS